GILPRDAEVGDVLFGHGLGSSDVAVLVHRDLVQAGAVRGEAGVGVVVQAIQLALVRSGHCAGSAGGGGLELQASRASLQAVGVGAVDLDRHNVGRADVDAVAAGVGIHQLIHGQVDMGRGVVRGLAVDDKIDVQVANLGASIGLVCGLNL